MTQLPRVSLALREKIFLICKRKPFRYLARCCYSLIALIVAYKLRRFSNSAEVYLRGKEASKSTPGLSDLDFWIFLPELILKEPQRLLELRVLFRKLNKRFVLPVKLEVTGREGWSLLENLSPASFLQDTPLIKFSASGWHKQEIIVPPVRALSRFNLCFFEYKSAQLCLRELAECRAYRTAVFAKHVKKLIEFADLGFEFREGSISELNAHALIVLDQLAATAIDDVPGPEMQADSSEYFREAGFSVRADPLSDTLVWEVDQPDLKSAERIFSVFEKAPVSEKFLVTRRIWRCLWRGMAIGPILENIDNMPAGFLGDEERSDIYLQTRDRLVTRINHNLGVLVSYNQREFLAPLLYQSFETLIIHTGQITKDLAFLCAIAEKDCPLTVKWVRRLTSDEIPSDLNEWAEAFIEVRSEAMKVACSAQRLRASSAG